MRDDDLKSMHIAVYALSLLGGGHQKVHTEFIAQKCLDISPGRFKWSHFSYPDKELVRKALFHASEGKNGALVVGRSGMEQRGKSRDGWQLTPAGAAWVRANEHLLGVGETRKTADVIPKRDADRLLKKLRSEPTYQMFARTGSVDDITPYMFTDLLNCSPDAPPETIRIKFNRLLTNAQLIGDREVIEFLNSCEARFADLVSQTKGSSA
ncbi:MAG: hypothetical protein ACRD2Q_05300 [Terriglobales bacterium]